MTAMKIRDLKWRGLTMWPPEWSVSYHQEGEKGVLEDVQLRQELSKRLISIEANHLGDCRKGIMVLEDPAQLEILYHKLKENLGRALTEIGDMEIEFTPSLVKFGLKQARPKSTVRNIKRVVNTK
jgi:hypothetical protein